ncbi:MAG: hypothetical protein Fur0022_14230 [Anaerolineales bacterium]
MSSNESPSPKPKSPPIFGPVLLSFVLYLLLFFVIWGIFGKPLPFWGAILLYVTCTLLVSSFQQRHQKKETPKILQNLPGSGPVGRLPDLVLGFTFSLSAILAIFNPFQFTQMIRQLAGQAAITKRLRDLPTPETYSQQVRYTLPFSGQWLVINGGTTPQNSHSWDILTQRYAYDFVITDDERRRHSENGTRLEDYYCYDQPILAVADGEVIKVSDGVRNAPLVGYGMADFLARDFRGNFVVIHHAPNEYSFSAHLIPGRIQVQEGQRITRGQVIGYGGHSGHSTEPHLHFHIQDHPDFFLGMGLPVKFENVSVDGEPQNEALYLQAGMFVQPPS